MSGQHIWLIDKPDAVQTQIRVGNLGIRRNDPNYIPVAVMNRIFGGGYNSRLNTEVRVKSGYTYGAYSSFNPHRYAGSFGVGTFTRTEATVQATKLVVDLLTKMSTGDITPEELDFARDYLAGVYPIQSETAEQVADRILTVAEFDLAGRLQRHVSGPDSQRDAQSKCEEMAQRYLETKDLDIVLAGNVSAFRDALKKDFPERAVRGDSLRPGGRARRRSAKAEGGRARRPLPNRSSKGKEILLAAAKAAGGDGLSSRREH